ncbi:tetratricopeptide repeat protein [Pseudolysobacter antarcticus]|uniref:Tetratricopeptide repeat protein n=1 Tax=Pseudolysobacter antarcticus TaxID=2511995 RepID=A0A411HMS2_9GAMM|nr:serine/threonine-protein kinase [Pseudolysobacter antarcticus]QBB71779.1 tetratricopeptide repeat protein [Pseudolysobacter antarcticus]
MNDTEKLALRIARDALDTDAAARDEFVSLRCGHDAALLRQVQSLLARISADEDSTDDAVQDREPVDALIGTTLGAYRIVEQVGRGGMGVVYRGLREGEDFAQTVAIKLIRRGFDFGDVHARFLRERRILARLAHPHLARFIDGGVAPDGRPWFALEFVRGESITRWCDVQRLDLRARVKLFLDVCAAVQYAHTQLIVHRDLKPGNVLVDETGAVRLLDFGIAGLLEGDEENFAAPLTVASRQVMTPEYAAPEQFIGATAVVASDVYALGVILYQLIAGVLPYEFDRGDLVAAERCVREVPPQSLSAAIQRAARSDADTPIISDATIATAVWPATLAQTDADARAAAQSSRTTDIVTTRLLARRTGLRAYRNTVRGDLSRIIEKALAKEPSRRYATVDAFAEDLSRWLGGEPVRVTGQRFGYRLGKFITRNRVAVGIAAALSLALISATGFALYKAHQEGIQRDAAIDETARATAVREYVMLMFGDAAKRRDSTTTTARDILKQGALEIFTKYKDRPKDGQEIALSLAELYMQIGDVEGAMPLLEGLMAWPDIEKNPSVLASARYDFSQAEYMRGKSAHARELLDLAQAFWSTQPQRFQVILNESRAPQAQLERTEGKGEQSVITLQHAIAERRALIGSSDREVAAAFNSLVLSLTLVGRYEDAINAAKEGYQVCVDLGQANTATGLALINNRAIAETYLGRYDWAEADYRLVVNMRQELYGESPELAGAQNNLALALARQNRMEEATHLLEDALRISLAQAGESGRETMMSRANLADAYATTGRATEALPLAEAALKNGLALYGAKSAFTGIAYRSRAKTMLALGKIAEARADLDAATAVFVGMGKGGEIQLKTLLPLREKLAAHE